MAGLNFQTLTIINSLNDKDSKNSVLFKKVELNEQTHVPEHVHIKRDFNLFKGATPEEAAKYGKVVSMYKKKGYDFEACKATITFNGSGETSLADRLQTVDGKKASKTYCRLDLYLGVEGAEPFIYSTPWVQKGMPFWIEFTVTSEDTASTIAEKIAKAIKDNHIFQCDKDLINVEVSGHTLTFTGANEYQRFRKIEIVRYIDGEDASEVITSMKKANETGFDSADIKLVVVGKNAFGTYSQIVKDLRLPTAANWQPYHVRQSETPIVGAVYNQYIINYVAPATNEGLGAVGQALTSNTTHVFWVKQEKELVEAFENTLLPCLASDFEGEAKEEGVAAASIDPLV